jgi:hypothetical protein
MTFADTPDFQRSVATSGSELASDNGTHSSLTVTLTANAESIVIGCGAGGTIDLLSVVGVTTGIRYPFAYATPLQGGSAAQSWVAAVAPSLDSQVVVNLSVAPGLSWYVAADQGVRVIADSVLAGLVQVNGVAGQKIGLMAFGTDGTNARALRTNQQGLPYDIPSAPDVAVGDHPPNELVCIANFVGTGMGNLLAPPGAGVRYRLFHVSAQSGGGGDYLEIDAGGLRLVVAGQVPGGAPNNLYDWVDIPLTGLAVAANTAISYNCNGTNNYRVIYTIETV